MTENNIPSDSVGVVTPQRQVFDQPLSLISGSTLPSFELVYETYGELNAEKTNAVLICHALSSNHHVAGYHSAEDKRPGWWENYVGPGKPIDTNKFFVVCANNIGGCHGSTGPLSINPETGKPWGPDFPTIRVRDWVKTQALLMDVLSIECWAAVIGGSLGGMQAMRWCVDYPDRLRHCVIIAAAAKLTAQNIAFNETARQAIKSDPDFHDGRYAEYNVKPANGLATARMIGHITYLSDSAMREKFGRDLRSGAFDGAPDVEFQVQSYLQAQGKKFADQFDANTYLLMTKTLDYFDLSRDFDHDLSKPFEQTKSKFLVLSFSTDWRFAPERSREIVDALVQAKKPVTYAEIDSPAGHDAFLLPMQRYSELFAAYMNSVAQENS